MFPRHFVLEKELCWGNPISSLAICSLSSTEGVTFYFFPFWLSKLGNHLVVFNCHICSHTNMLNVTWAKAKPANPFFVFSENPHKTEVRDLFLSFWIWVPHYISWRGQWHPTPVLLPGKPYGQRSLVGCSPWGC